MTVIIAFVVMFFILPNFIWTIGCEQQAEMKADTFQNDSFKTINEL